MPVDFQEYRGKRKQVNQKKRFPLLRLLLVALAAYLAYWSGLAAKIADALPLPGNADDRSVDSWEFRCKTYGGKPFSLRDSLSQCSWILDDSTRVSLLPNPFLRYVAQERKAPKSKLHWVTRTNDFRNAALVMHEDSVISVYLHYMKGDSSFVWISKNSGCRFPGVCPGLPLDWSALPISEDFDFEGQESLLAMDVFQGIGEAPIYPVLAGKVLDTGKDSVGYFIELDHGNNVTSRSSGMGSLGKTFAKGDTVGVETVLGRFPPKDSAVFFLTVRQNGQFIRWVDFYESAHPVTKDSLLAFEKGNGF